MFPCYNNWPVVVPGLFSLSGEQQLDSFTAREIRAAAATLDPPSLLHHEGSLQDENES